MKKVLYTITSFCFLAVSSTVAQKTEIKKVETTNARPAEKPVNAEKTEIKLVPTQKIVEVKKIESSKQLKKAKAKEVRKEEGKEKSKATREETKRKKILDEKERKANLTAE